MKANLSCHDARLTRQALLLQEAGLRDWRFRKSRSLRILKRAPAVPFHVSSQCEEWLLQIVRLAFSLAVDGSKRQAKLNRRTTTHKGT